MTTVKYEFTEHDGGWAYKVGEVFSEAFDTHADAIAAAELASQRHEVPGTDEFVEYQDAQGVWHEETASGRDRPQTVVADSAQIHPKINEQHSYERGRYPFSRRVTVALVGIGGFMVGRLFARHLR